MSEKRRNERCRLEDHSLSHDATFFEELQFKSRSILGIVYKTFEFEPLINLRLNISKLLGESIFMTLGSNRESNEEAWLY